MAGMSSVLWSRALDFGHCEQTVQAVCLSFFPFSSRLPAILLVSAASVTHTQY